jgi:hypothetical protein
MAQYKPRRAKKYLDGAPRQVVAIYDNGGKTWDRYTVVYSEPYDNRCPRMLECLGMSGNPFHPQGFGQHASAIRGPHLGRLIHWKDLPADCQRAVLQDCTPNS